MTPTKRSDNEASYKDPSGFVFTQNGVIYRQVNQLYRENYDLLFSSGVYKLLTDRGLLIKHTETDVSKRENVYKIIRPEQIPFISHPYEWSFSQLKDAALLTLTVQKIALSRGMILKDATPFNIQFFRGKPVFIDTLSFEKYREGLPWTPYRQFCEQFLAPLALYSYRDLRLKSLLIDSVGTISLDLAVKLLPWSAKINPGIFIHLVMHAQSQSRVVRVSDKTRQSRNFTRLSMSGLIDSLEKTVENLKFPGYKTVWTDYAGTGGCPSYETGSYAAKKAAVKKFITLVKPEYVWDIGANTGDFSRIASGSGAFTVSMDFDPTVVESNYLQVKNKGETGILPLLMNVTNPTPGTGWINRERPGILDRPHPDTVLALAIIHHLAITGNIPLSKIAEFLASLCQNLIIEFVPKSDPQTQKLLHNREDIFDRYNEYEFLREFGIRFTLVNSEKLAGSDRTVYLFKVKPAAYAKNPS
jgi:ribosomal protein L11 methylase PrmA